MSVFIAMVHDRGMRGLHPSFARRIDRWLERCGSAFVMEIESHDGTRYLVGLDPNWQGAPLVAITDDPEDGGASWADGLRAPDDLRDLVP